jgi:thiamine biosynthesis protein ThiC
MLCYVTPKEHLGLLNSGAMKKQKSINDNFLALVGAKNP